jgi:CRISPR/Cas system CMR-associated protein Cmr5 small subunit
LINYTVREKSIFLKALGRYIFTIENYLAKTKDSYKKQELFEDLAEAKSLQMKVFIETEKQFTQESCNII